MIQLDQSIQKIARRAALRLVVQPEKILIRHEWRFNQLWHWLVFLYFLTGICACIAPLFAPPTFQQKEGFIYVGPIFIIFSLGITAVLLSNYVRIENHQLNFRFFVTKKSIPISPYIKVVKEVKVLKSYKQNAVVVSHFIEKAEGKTPILRYQMQTKDEADARKLGDAINQILNSRIS